MGIKSVLSCREGRCYSRLSPLSAQATLRIRNSNFYSVTVTSLTSQVQYMNTVVGTQQITNVSSIQPLSDKLVFVFHCACGISVTKWSRKPVCYCELT